MNPLHKATSIKVFLNEKSTGVPHAVIYFPRNGIKFGKNNFTKIEMDLSSFTTVSGIDLKDTRPVTVKADSRKYHNSRAAALREVGEGEGKYLSGRWNIGEHRSITIDLALTVNRCVGTAICEQKKKKPISAVLKREGINGTEYRIEFNSTPAAAMATKMVIESTKTVTYEKAKLTHDDVIEMIKGDNELYHKVACIIRRDRATKAPRENNLVKQSAKFLVDFEKECTVPANEESDFINAPKTVDETTFDNESNDRKVLAIELEQEPQVQIEMNMMDAIEEAHQEPQEPARSREVMKAIWEWMEDYADAPAGPQARLKQAIGNIDFTGMDRDEAFDAIGSENTRLSLARMPKAKKLHRDNWHDQAA
jgi:hypothetical protein